MRRLVIALVVIGAVGAGGWLGWTWLAGAGGAGPAVPTQVVTRQRFTRTVVAEGNLRAVKATPLVVPQVAGGGGPMKLAYLAPEGTRVAAGDVVVRFDPTEPDKQLREGQADLASAEARLAQEHIQSEAAVAGRDGAAVLAEQELERTRAFQSKDPIIFSRNQVVESEIDEHLARAKQEHATSTKGIERSLSRSKAAVIAVEQKKAALAISHARSALAMMSLSAPHAGVLVYRRGWRGNAPRVGDQLWPGQTVAELPLLDAMEAEIFVLEVDANGLAEGQAVAVVVEAAPEQEFAGTIRLVEKLAKPRMAGSPVQYFAVTVALARTEPALMKPGQRVRATVTLESSDALVVPRQAVVSEGDRNLVFRRGPSGFEPVAVELGASTAGRVVITSGLQDGDRIAVRDPRRSAAQSLAGSGSAGAATPGAGGGGGGEGGP